MLTSENVTGTSRLLRYQRIKPVPEQEAKKSRDPSPSAHTHPWEIHIQLPAGWDSACASSCVGWSVIPDKGSTTLRLGIVEATMGHTLVHGAKIPNEYCHYYQVLLCAVTTAVCCHFFCVKGGWRSDSQRVDCTMITVNACAEEQVGATYLCPPQLPQRDYCRTPPLAP